MTGISIHDSKGNDIGEYIKFTDRVEMWVHNASDFDAAVEQLTRHTGIRWKLIHKHSLGKHMTARFTPESPVELKAAS